MQGEFAGLLLLLAFALLALTVALRFRHRRAFRARIPRPRAIPPGVPETGAPFAARFALQIIAGLLVSVAIAFLMPWAVVVRALGVSGVVAIVVFLVPLVVGLLHARRHGAFEW